MVTLLIFNLVFSMNLLITYQFVYLLKLNKTHIIRKQNILIIALNINDTNNIHQLMNELNETNSVFIKSEDINISLDIFIYLTHFSKIYDKTFIQKQKSNNIFHIKKICHGLQKV